MKKKLLIFLISIMGISCKKECLIDEVYYESYRYELWKYLIYDAWEIDFIGTKSDSGTYLDYLGKSFDKEHEGTKGMKTKELLNNLTVIIDRNYSRNDAIPLGDIKKKFLGFSKNIITVNGHNHRQIYKALNKSYKNSNPKIIIAKTIKGNGLKMIQHNSWHHRFPKDYDEFLNLCKNIKK